MISKRRLMAYEAAEETCRALRVTLGTRACDVTQEDHAKVIGWLIKWMDLSGNKSKFANPKPIPKKRSS